MRKLTPILRNRAVDIYAHTPEIQHSEVAKLLDITPKTLMKLRKAPQFFEELLYVPGKGLEPSHHKDTGS